jgi:hypothetical protein
MTEVEILLLGKTPASHIIRKFFPEFYSSWPGECSLSNLPEKLKRLSHSKIFLFAHDMALHDEMFVDSECKPLPADAPRDWSYQKPSQQMHQQIDCMNTQIVEMVDGILAFDPKAVILLMGDHGFWPGDCPECLQEIQTWKDRNAIFSAMRLPVECQKSFKTDLSPVNYHRVILSCLNGTAPNLLPNRYFKVETDVDRGNSKLLNVIEWFTNKEMKQL